MVHLDRKGGDNMEKYSREWVLDPAEVTATIAKLEKIIARANKSGLQGGWQLTSEPFGQGQKIILEGSPFKFDGWTFVASVEWLPNSECITKSSPLYEGAEISEDSLRYGECDHCQTKRYRKSQVIVEKDGIRKTVGSTCVKDFLGWEFSPVIFSDVSEQIEEYFGSIGGGWYGDQASVIATALKVISIQGGYIKANDNGTPTTTDTVRKVLFDSSSLNAEFKAKYKDCPNTDEEATQILEAARDWASSNNGDYARNLKAALTGDWAFKSTIGLIVSAISVVKAAELKEAKIAAETAAQEELEADVTQTTIFKDEGAKFEVDGKVTDLVTFVGGYGPTTIVTFTADGFRFKWFASNRGAQEFEIGKTYAFKGTVKGLDTYNGKVSTLVTRCKFENK